MLDEDKQKVSKAISDWKSARLKFGNFNIVYGYENLLNIDEARIWTQSNPGADDEYITNEFIPIEDLSFYVFERPYEDAVGDLVLYLSMLIKCEYGESEECENCNGEGVYSLSILQE